MANIRDVARRANVSTATVSRALSGADGVTETTRDRVLQSVRDLGYVPKQPPSRRSLDLSSAVSLIVPDLENPFYGSIAKGMQRRARASEWVTTISESAEDVGHEIAVAEQLLGVARGVVLASPRSSDEDLLRLASQGRIVLINREVDGIASVSSDNHQGLVQTFQHLRALGHHRIGYAGGPTTSWSEGERRATLGALEADGHLSNIEVVDLGYFDIGPSGGLAAADLAISSGATAVVAFNDHLALGLMARLQERGLRVPQDISVVGFDDVPTSKLLSPPLTTVAIPAVLMGERAVELLCGAGDEYQNAPHIRSRVELQVRSSTSVVGN